MQGRTGYMGFSCFDSLWGMNAFGAAVCSLRAPFSFADRVCRSNDLLGMLNIPCKHMQLCVCGRAALVCSESCMHASVDVWVWLGG